ncbi:ketopantoate reductase family protein [Methylobacterium sp. J-070]|uniref:ketopantoate reductase family protein n=1 Tax=Methylobacterium sp. J-070 TaxID=2836650 RepID=UPI001FBC060C|nr:ketopantoate reductase family protein [Methylobacterium sp. J-070]MCJ2048754.1 ketopantoate reductase family protein [Methylobacterium sp. J-070]
MRLLVVGAGSTGGYIGGRLAQAGRDVTFLVRPRRAERLRREGLKIISPLGDASVEPQLATADTVDGPFDAILLSVKGFQLDAALDDLRPAVGPRTMILPVLNGMRHMETLAARFSSENLVGCALKIATILDEEGRVLHLTPLQDLAYGELDGGTTPRIEALHELMQAGGFEPRLSREIRREMWEKWILLASLGAVTCLMRGPIGEIEAAPGGPAFALAVLDEAVATVRAVGTGPSDAFLAATRDQLTAKGSPLTSSMYRDLRKGRPVEVENIIGDLVRSAAEASIETPLLAAAYAHLSVYQNGIRKD